ncbi:non-heme iron oxygenase ferredoxin subunit [Methylicorpusculum oleiharenae]|uniref:non-heme iron oxygenase ferredoxin subunit n=1 Tax=Methylicorpusculum oleiharenae TaxID=1338687 RepID=UPI001358DBA6|nr:non-heme iron oxygenase ferredoxin subunit [Methylicorpusculum oleiharenae]MCD2453198.1 non-heme iron oxygenase ferredoxin subunit [Methylicorpusculum oleiharenae]
MSEWIDVVSQNALSEGEHVVVDVDGVDVAVFNLEGSFYAIEDVCSHDGAEIASGELEGDEIICPRHGARFCVKTGQVKSAPAYEDIACFKVRIENERVQVRDDRWD